MTTHDEADDAVSRILDGLDSSLEDPELSTFLTAMQASFGHDHVPPVGTALSEFVNVDLIVDKGDLLATAASNASGPAPQVSGLPKRRDAFINGISERRRRMISTISAFVGTVAGKIAVGTTVAMAATGGMHAAGVVDIPVLPEVQTAAVLEEVEVEETAVEVGDESLSTDGATDQDVDETQASDEDSDVALAFADDDATEDSVDEVDEVDEADEVDAWELCSIEADAIEDASEGLGDDAEDAASDAADAYLEACEADVERAEADAWELCSIDANAIEDAAEGLGDDAEDAASDAADAFEEACEIALDGELEVDLDELDELDELDDLDELDELDDLDELADIDDLADVDGDFELEIETEVEELEIEVEADESRLEYESDEVEAELEIEGDEVEIEIERENDDD